MAPARAAAQASPASSVATVGEGKAIVLEGTVSGYRPAGEKGPHSFMVKDGSGEARVVIWPDVYAQVAGHEGLGNNAKVKVTGKTEVYRGKPEVLVEAGQGLVIVSAVSPAHASAPAAAATPAAPVAHAEGATASVAGVTPMASLKTLPEEQPVVIEGTITAATRPRTERAPYLLKVTDASGGTADVAMWQDLVSQLPEPKPNVGARIRVSGKSGVFRGTQQVKPEAAGDLKIVQQGTGEPTLNGLAPAGSGAASGGGSAGRGAAAAVAANTNPYSPANTLAFNKSVASTPSKLPARAIAPAEVATAKEGEHVSVEGRVAGIEPIRLGRRVTLEAASNGAGAEKATVLLWDTAGLRSLAVGSHLSVAGLVAASNGSKFVVVSDPADVHGSGKDSSVRTR